MRRRASGERSSWDTSRSNWTLAADQALQAFAHAVEIARQGAQFIAAPRQAGQAVLLVGGLAEVVHGAPQTVQRTGDGQRQQQAEQGQHHQCDAQRAERPEQAAAVPGLQLRVRDAVDEQIGMVALRADVFLAQLAPGEARQVAVAGARRAVVGARQVGAVDQALAAFIEYLDGNPVVATALLQQALGRVAALFFVEGGPLLGEILQARMAGDDPGVLVQRTTQQDGQPGDQQQGQPEGGEDSPEE